MVGNDEQVEALDTRAYMAKYAEANVRLGGLVGEEVRCRPSGSGQGHIDWKVIPDHVPISMPIYRSRSDLGFNWDEVDFDMNDKYL